MFTSSKLLMCAAAALAFPAGVGLTSVASAASVTTSGSFQNTIGGTNVNTQPVAGFPRPGFANATFLNFGNPLSGGIPEGQSGFVFEGLSPITLSPVEGLEFDVGGFTHRNAPTTLGSNISSTQLNITLANGGESQSSFDIEFIQTTNALSGPACAAAQGSPGGIAVEDENGCGDVVNFPSVFSETQINVDDEDFFVEILGFEQDGVTTAQFKTLEDADNNAVLRARLRSEVPVEVVPLPAAAWLFLAGIGSLLGISWRNRKTAA